MGERKARYLVVASDEDADRVRAEQDRFRQFYPDNDWRTNSPDDTEGVRWEKAIARATFVIFGDALSAQAESVACITLLEQRLKKTELERDMAVAQAKREADTANGLKESMVQSATDSQRSVDSAEARTRLLEEELRKLRSHDGHFWIRNVGLCGCQTCRVAKQLETVRFELIRLANQARDAVDNMPDKP